MSKLILITGISKGLGYAITEGFIQQGHTVIGCARSSDAIHRAMDTFYASVEQQDNPSYAQQTVSSRWESQSTRRGCSS